MHLCLAVQIYEHFSCMCLMYAFNEILISGNDAESDQSKKSNSYSNKLKNSLWNAFKISADSVIYLIYFKI